MVRRENALDSEEIEFTQSKWRSSIPHTFLEKQKIYQNNYRQVKEFTEGYVCVYIDT